jgi:hypothetical protein
VLAFPRCKYRRSKSAGKHPLCIEACAWQWPKVGRAINGLYLLVLVEAQTEETRYSYSVSAAVPVASHPAFPRFSLSNMLRQLLCC